MTQQLVDTHCHIQSIGAAAGERSTREIWAKHPELIADGVVEAATEQGVTRMICVGCDLADSRQAVDFVKNRANCWASVGVHPHEAKQFIGSETSSDMAGLASLLTESKVVAIGECGLDYHYNHSPKEQQLAALEFQLELAQESGLPVIFHVREAFDDFWPIFDSYSGLRGVLHSYTDSLQNMQQGIERGLYVGVNGIATFAKNPEQLEVYKSIPLEKLLLETDAPFLTPHPYRGSINEPKRLGEVAGFVAELRGESLQDLAIATTNNAVKLFGI
ncbi:preprotein translocase [Candidatus Saccharibacteria bacterium CG_4_10_14_0_2_um_filter_52_9]|nr:MAG: preprotein translocase [Candidatus Saccharibacteria bacterium CG_4_10_14_0_2_um_filter_52_9]